MNNLILLNISFVFITLHVLSNIDGNNADITSSSFSSYAHKNVNNDHSKVNDDYNDYEDYGHDYEEPNPEKYNLDTRAIGTEVNPEGYLVKSIQKGQMASGVDGSVDMNQFDVTAAWAQHILHKDCKDNVRCIERKAELILRDRMKTELNLPECRNDQICRYYRLDVEKEYKEREYCPITHPTAYREGKSCCSTEHWNANNGNYYFHPKECLHEYTTGGCCTDREPNECPKDFCYDNPIRHLDEYVTKKPVNKSVNVLMDSNPLCTLLSTNCSNQQIQRTCPNTCRKVGADVTKSKDNILCEFANKTYCRLEEFKNSCPNSCQKYVEDNVHGQNECVDKQDWCRRNPNCALDMVKLACPKACQMCLEEGSTCPEDYPWVYRKGEYCSASWKEDKKETFNNTCVGSFIQFNSSCSIDPRPLQCPKRPCKNNLAICPDSSPFAYLYGDYCCSSALEKSEPEFLRDGNGCKRRVTSWESSCCKDNMPFKCLNPPCRDASVANSAKLEYYFDHLKGDQYKSFFQEDVFLVKKGWHNRVEKEQEETLFTQKRLFQQRQKRQAQSQRMNNAYSKNTDLMPAEMFKIGSEINNREELLSFGKVNVDMHQTLEQSQTPGVPNLNSADSTYDKISLLIKTLGDSYKCRSEACKKYSRILEEAKLHDLPRCLNPPCNVHQSDVKYYGRDQSESNSWGNVEEDVNANVMMSFVPQLTTASAKDSLSNPDTSQDLWILIGILSMFVSFCCCCCFCGCIRECMKYVGRVDAIRGRSKEEYFLRYEDNYLHREQRKQKEITGGQHARNNTTASTACLSDDVVGPFESHFKFRNEFPPPTQPATSVRSHEITGKQRSRKRSNITKNSNSNLNVDMVEEAAASYHPYEMYSNAAYNIPQQMNQKELGKPESIANTKGRSKEKKQFTSGDFLTIERGRYNRANQNWSEDSSYQKFSHNLRNNDRKKWQSSGNLDKKRENEDSCGRHSSLSSGSKILQSFLPSDGSTTSSTDNNIDYRVYRTSTNVHQKEDLIGCDLNVPSSSSSGPVTSPVQVQGMQPYLHPFTSNTVDSNSQPTTLASKFSWKGIKSYFSMQ